MKLYKLNLLHNGKQNHQMVKEGVTAPEVILLMAVHGPQAVSDVKETGENKNIKQDEEKNRLVYRYGQKVFTTTFPGFAPNFPYGLEQVGIQAEPFNGELPFQMVGKSIKESAEIRGKKKEDHDRPAETEPATAPMPAAAPAQSEAIEAPANAPQVQKPFGAFNIPNRVPTE